MSRRKLEFERDAVEWTVEWSGVSQMRKWIVLFKCQVVEITFILRDIFGEF